MKSLWWAAAGALLVASGAWAADEPKPEAKKTEETIQLPGAILPPQAYRSTVTSGGSLYAQLIGLANGDCCPGAQGAVILTDPRHPIRVVDVRGPRRQRITTIENLS